MSRDPQVVKDNAYKCFEKGDFQGALKLLTSISVQYGNNAELSNPPVSEFMSQKLESIKLHGIMEERRG